ncbi:dihydroorotate dehydrogenase (quinone) [Candidatus Saccharibacteria bacterium CG11_big_fil_rev_8_21_14_0_20_41_19]|nr:quinone-dependent dihydroorotate dehydrogenase [Candidatus Saccharibacteria bacterium]OIP86350.1 MAG: dihydroorotate dehydrogenase (quinone) [Candidatus Saccharibacteria bacterium CG2_30_41_52]PIQ71133.1 MAG: dihydroorotate dehydrogenase (quinone) [Candidatus Saccharibacteria bacterium CG11_big_fil_rev_8_21_14_0_20_41_19]PIZ59949.1 MAG: quinone-dependent dihydroorotate dehydrogenase [Candidatus Saccharibacteria bacterium CG_4_10_14_0_2_um_filter_41_11]PJC30002.1 MAG: quinone-dependent dihydr
MIKRTLWTINRKSYAVIAKPLLFMASPDKAHSMMILATSKMGYVPIARGFVKTVFTRKRDERLAQQYFGIDFHTPVGLSAGFDKNGEIVPMIARLGFGFGTVGSVTAVKCAGNPRPWFYRLPKSKSLVINAGLANDGSEAILKRIHNYSAKAIGQFPIVLSVAKTNSQKVVDIKTGIADYVATVKRAQQEPRIKMIELNISCPNAYGGEPFTTPERLEQLLSAVDAVGPKQPVTVKMPIDHEWPAFKKLLDVIVKHKVTAVTISNLYKDRASLDLKDHLPDSVKGNLSGEPTWQKSNDLISKTFLEYGDRLTVIGVGGIFTAEQAYAKIKMGASLIEIITGVIFIGPQLAAEINDGLVKLMQRDGYKNISEVIGVDAKPHKKR